MRGNEGGVALSFGPRDFVLSGSDAGADALCFASGGAEIKYAPEDLESLPFHGYYAKNTWQRRMCGPRGAFTVRRVQAWLVSAPAPPPPPPWDTTPPPPPHLPQPPMPEAPMQDMEPW